VTARHWTAQYEWYAHHRLALKAGLNPSCRGRILRRAGVPRACRRMKPSSTTSRTNCTTSTPVSDATFKAAVDRFGEQGVVDLIAVKRLLRARLDDSERGPRPHPGGGKPPLSVLK